MGFMVKTNKNGTLSAGRHERPLTGMSIGIHGEENSIVSVDENKDGSLVILSNKDYTKKHNIKIVECSCDNEYSNYGSEEKLIMLLKDINLKATAYIRLKMEPAKESVYVGNICLEKNGKKYRFDFNKYDVSYTGNILVLNLSDCTDIDAPDDAVLEDLINAKVTDFFLQGDEERYVEGQVIKDIIFDIYDGFDKENHIVTLYTSSFTETDFGEFYGLEETECKKATK